MELLRLLIADKNNNKNGVQAKTKRGHPENRRFLKKKKHPILKTIRRTKKYPV